MPALSIDLGHLGIHLRPGLHGGSLAEFGERVLGLVESVVRQSPIQQQAILGRLQLRGFLIFGNRTIEASLIVVGQGELEMIPRFVGRFAYGIFPQRDGAGPDCGAGVGRCRSRQQYHQTSGGQSLAFDFQAECQIHQDQQQPQHRQIQPAFGDRIFDGQDG